MSSPENVLSNAGLEAEIEASADVSLWTFWLEGTEFLALRLDTATWVMPERTKTWHEFASYGETNWLPVCYAGGRFGASSGGGVLQWSTGHLDMGGVLERRFRAGAPLNSGSLLINNLALRTNPGNTPYLSGDYAEPCVEMRLSRDAGRTWGSWREASLGRQGEYRKKVQWIGCGMFGQPGILAEFRVTDPVDFRVSDVLLNEPVGGV
jgi:hypothetical protein